MALKRRIVALALILCLLCCALPPAVAAADVCFIAANDQLLELTAMPYTTGGVVYIPYWVFTNYFGLYYNYFSDSVTASVYTEQKQLYFDMSTGNTYDANDRYYSASAVFRNGQVYLPAAFVCSQFGLVYSYVSGSAYGDVVRIKDGRVALTDSQFLSAAAQLMESRYRAYQAGTVTPTPEVSPGMDDNELPSREGTAVYLSFQGLPSGDLLDTLERYEVTSCFFLTAEEIRSAPDTVRAILSGGHRIGIFCGEDATADYAQASALLYEAAREKTLLVTADPGADGACRTLAETEALVFWSYNIDGVREGEGVTDPAHLTSYIDVGQTRVDVRLACGDNTDRILPPLLVYLIQNHFDLRQVREIENFEG